jgi:hypothetical protein
MPCENFGNLSLVNIMRSRPQGKGTSVTYLADCAYGHAQRDVELGKLLVSTTINTTQHSITGLIVQVFIPLLRRRDTELHGLITGETLNYISKGKRAITTTA